MTAKRVVRRRTEEESSNRRVVRRSSEKPRKRRVSHGENWHPEAALLSTMIQDHVYHDVLEAGISEDWFHAYADEWSYMHRFLIRHKATPTIRAWHRKFPDFEVLPSEDLNYLIDEVRQSHARHSLLMMVGDVTDGIRGKIDPTDVLKRVERSVMALHQQVDGGGASQSDMSDDWEQTYAEVSARVARASHDGMSGVTTGFPTLDNLTGGIDLGHYWVVGARLKGGKTWGLGRMVTSAAISGNKCLYFSLEMPRRQMEMRLHNFLSSEYGQEVFRSVDLMRGRGFDLLAYKKFLRRMSSELAGKIIIDDRSKGKITPMTVAAQIEQHRPRLVFIDYLTLMSDSNDWQSIADLSTSIKGLASDYGEFCSIVAAAQVNRAGAGKEPPSADDLAGSDGIGRDVDCVVTLASHSKRVKRWKLAAYRHGPDQQKWWTALDLDMGTFKEISGNTAQDMIQEDEEAASMAMDDE